MRTLFTAAALVCWTAYPASGQLVEEGKFLLTETEAFLLLPPEIVAGPVVKRAVWSGDGTLLLAERHDTVDPEFLKVIAAGLNPKAPPPLQSGLLVWNSRSRKTVEVWKGPIGASGIESITWLPRSSVALAKVWQNHSSPNHPGRQERVERVLRISAVAGQARVITGLPGQILSQVSVSPTLPLALVESIAIPEMPTVPDSNGIRQAATVLRRLHIVRENGTVSAPIALPVPRGAPEILWTADGRDAALKVFDPDATAAIRKQRGKNAEPVFRWFVLDTFSARLQPADSAPPLYRPDAAPPPPISLRMSDARVSEGETSGRVSLLWLESSARGGYSRVLVNANLDSAELSPNLEGILQIDQGAAMVTPLARMPRQEFLRARELAQRALALSRAKQLGLALHMFAQDSDGVLPGPEGVNDKIQPYLKNSGLFEGFNYTFPGGPLDRIDKPAETELGWVNGPGGRAIIYVDGHAKWRPD